jgi:dUTP pyrophosphatase
LNPIKIKKLHPLAKVPAYAHDTDACFDLHACMVDGTAYIGRHVEPGYPVTFGTGLAFEVPEGWAMLIFSRSGQGFIHGVRLANCVGVIDAGFRGEVMVKLTSDALEGDPVIADKPPYFVQPGDRIAQAMLVIADTPPYFVQPGDRIAQAMLVPVHRVAFEVVEELGDSERGAGGLGSTGA